METVQSRPSTQACQYRSIQRRSCNREAESTLRASSPLADPISAGAWVFADHHSDRDLVLDNEDRLPGCVSSVNFGHDDRPAVARARTHVRAVPARGMASEDKRRQPQLPSLLGLLRKA